MTNFRRSRTQFAANNFKFDKNGKKFSKQEENTAGIGETAHYKQFLISKRSHLKSL